MEESPTPRQQREIDYHQGHAELHAELAQEIVDLDVVNNEKRRWWNAYWSTYTTLQTMNLRDKKILVPGCGFAADAIRLARLGGKIYAFDLSTDILNIAKERASINGYDDINFELMPTEKLTCPDNFFDVVFFYDILHHVEIQQTMEEVCRVLKPGGIIMGCELYTHDILENTIRKSTIVDKFLYPLMVKFIYGTSNTYITEDEHKISDKEFELVTDKMVNFNVQYFNIFIGRLLPDRFTFWCKVDRLIAKCFGSKSRFLAGRVLFRGQAQV